MTKFPENFLFGAATSAHQIEGNNTTSDWWEWEHSPARRAELSRRGLDLERFISGSACDHWNRFRDDVALVKDLSHNAYRFSIEWARVEPRQGEWDEKVIGHYREVLEVLHERNITPLVTLHHFTNPLWFSRLGGWERRDADGYFARYIEKVIGALGGLARYWMPINEPQVLAQAGWLWGSWPPQKHDPSLHWRVKYNLLRAHRRAFSIIRGHAPNAKVGFVHSYAAFVPQNPANPADRFLRHIPQYFNNDFWLSRVNDSMDFIGLNYYRTFSISMLPPWVRELGNEKSDMGWGIYPKGLGAALRELQAYKKPIIITENGIADSRDARRCAFIVDHLREVLGAYSDGVDVRGYLYWSLLDNFEWADGFVPRFGLVEVNYSTQQRTPRKSASLFSEIIRTRQLPKEKSE